MKMLAPAAGLILSMLAGCGPGSLFTLPGACNQDSDCGANAYCAAPLTSCGSDSREFTASPGQCHRNCEMGACTCADDTDCPGTSCNNGVCAGLPTVMCPFVSCDESCTLTTAASLGLCPICLCTSCGAADGGSVDGGFCAKDGASCLNSSDCCNGSCNLDTVDQGGHCYPAADAGSADAGTAPCGCATCGVDEICIAATRCGGVVGTPCETDYSCASTLGCSATASCGCYLTDAACAEAPACAIDGGILSCNIYLP